VKYAVWAQRPRVGSFHISQDFLRPPPVAILFHRMEKAGVALYRRLIVSNETVSSHL